jgi:hypothetical protein
VTLESPEIMERCRDLVEAPQALSNLRLVEDTDEPAMGNDPYNYCR